MKTYQTLVLIGGIIGIVLVPIMSIVIGLTYAVGSSLYGDITGISGMMSGGSAAVSIILGPILAIIAIILVFVVKKPKPVGGVVLFLGVLMLATTHVYGVPSWILFFVGGIVAIRYKPKDAEIGLGRSNPEASGKDSDSLGILNDRYAKGEITREQYNQMKEDLYGSRSDS